MPTRSDTEVAAIFAMRPRFLGDQTCHPQEVLKLQQLCERCFHFTGDGCRRLEPTCGTRGRWKQTLLNGRCDQWG
jgi:hypothetical protein